MMDTVLLIFDHQLVRKLTSGLNKVVAVRQNDKASIVVLKIFEHFVNVAICGVVNVVPMTTFYSHDLILLWTYNELVHLTRAWENA